MFVINSGIIRKIDDLGRIVLPKELRKTLNINSGDDFQISIVDNKIILEKYSRLESYENLINKIILSFSNELNYNIFVTKNDKLINNNEIIAHSLYNIILSRKMYVRDKIEKNIINNNIVVEGKIVLLPIVIDSDLLGSIIIIANDNINNMINISKIIYNLIKGIINKTIR